MKEIEKFICCLYGFPYLASVDDVRVNILMKNCEKNGILDTKQNIDLGNFPPCFDSLKQHIL